MITDHSLNLVKRYKLGEFREVWSEVRSLGDTVREPKYFEDAWAVAVETMKRVRRNVELLISRLRTAGYEFTYPSNPDHYHLDRAHAPPDEETPAFVEWLEKLVGPLPLSVRAWILYVGDVNLVGNHPCWPKKDMPTDALVIEFELKSYRHLGPRYDGKVRATGNYQWWKDLVTRHGVEAVGPHKIIVSPDVWHKVNISGAAPYGIVVPDRSADGRIDLAGNCTFFIEYLRECFHWGGFPGFNALPPSSDTGTIVALREGLLEI